ncbi:MAG: hypothetical protein R3D70_08530 [Rhizobiaceae bacterium]
MEPREQRTALRIVMVGFVVLCIAWYQAREPVEIASIPVEIE